mmetsp:Transcript_38556/g.46621  ORF Transcript_38556/g.46621 Transcript_38556/m.46621 type:complete len:197 (-) Transcript_38556:324-914(-)|eukprot:CAMPEP_0197851018 /NCGR_PEP_ID=MMETSP1438-20131217/17013_1 /TAXON_ID=1461541 /ORGANISM="Pterosperma sp., Strain CCMP1384" /LENGTH=196 /DNA_ID=CAMNT_0043464473 /DNA_START=143 /DNA_END=733 /DNA_ORIENTATION=-
MLLTLNPSVRCFQSTAQRQCSPALELHGLGNFGHTAKAFRASHEAQFVLRKTYLPKAAEDDDSSKPPKKKKKAKKFPKGGMSSGSGPGLAPMYMQTDEQRKADRQFRKGGVDDGGGGGGGRGGDGGDDGGWSNGDGEANPIGLLICGATAIAAFLYYKKQKADEEEAKERDRERERRYRKRIEAQNARSTITFRSD